MVTDNRIPPVPQNVIDTIRRIIPEPIPKPYPVPDCTVYLTVGYMLGRLTGMEQITAEEAQAAMATLSLVEDWRAVSMILWGKLG